MSFCFEFGVFILLLTQKIRIWGEQWKMLASNWDFLKFSNFPDKNSFNNGFCQKPSHGQNCYGCLLKIKVSKTELAASFKILSCWSTKFGLAEWSVYVLPIQFSFDSTNSPKKISFLGVFDQNNQPRSNRGH